jgi:hypothetical protein
VIDKIHRLAHSFLNSTFRELEMSTEEKKYRFELCERRGVKLHSIVTDFSANVKHDIKAMTGINSIAAPSQGRRQKPGSSPMKCSSNRDIQQQPAYTYQKYTYEHLLQTYRNFFFVGPLMRCLDSDENSDEKLVSKSSVFSE